MDDEVDGDVDQVSLLQLYDDALDVCQHRIHHLLATLPAYSGRDSVRRRSSRRRMVLLLSAHIARAHAAGRSSAQNPFPSNRQPEQCVHS